MPSVRHGLDIFSAQCLIQVALRREKADLVLQNATYLNVGSADRVDISSDVLKIAVLERHHATGHIGIGYLEGCSLTHGAMTTSIAHDSHKLIRNRSLYDAELYEPPCDSHTSNSYPRCF